MMSIFKRKDEYVYCSLCKYGEWINDLWDIDAIREGKDRGLPERCKKCYPDDPEDGRQRSMRTKYVKENINKHPYKHIPPGVYCYTLKSVDMKTGRMKINLCPFWRKNPFVPSQVGGYCKHLKKGDWMKNSTSLLWDMCKECGINDDWEIGDNEIL